MLMRRQQQVQQKNQDIQYSKARKEAVRGHGLQTFNWNKEMLTKKNSFWPQIARPVYQVQYSRECAMKLVLTKKCYGTHDWDTLSKF